VEHPADHKLYRHIARWLDGPAAIDKPPVLETRGRKNIASIVDLSDDLYQSAVRQWAASVWAAYESQQYLARTWLADVLKHRSGL
jgi:hypothetical protein